MRKMFFLAIIIAFSFFVVSCQAKQQNSVGNQNVEKEVSKAAKETSQKVVSEKNTTKAVVSEVKRSPNAAPDFEFVNLQDGQKYKLSDFTGKVVIIDFWATWCPPCRMEIPHFIEFYKEYKDKGLEIIGISFDRDSSTVKAFAAQNGIKYMLTMGTRELAQKYGGINGIPTTFFIRKNGEIANLPEVGDNKVVGYHPADFFKKIIERLLKE